MEMTAGLSAQDKLEGSALTLTLEQRSEMGQGMGMWNSVILLSMDLGC